MLWIADASGSGEPRPISRGLFPECPSWASAGHDLAYLVRRPGPAEPWTLARLRNGTTQTLASFDLRATSNFGPRLHRTFDWTPRGKRLVFLNSSHLSIFAQGRVRRFGPTATLRRIERLSVERGFGSPGRIFRFSPNGRFVAVGIGGATGILRTDGTLVRVVPGLFRGWGGNQGVLVVDLYQGSPSLFLYPANGQLERKLIVKGFKRSVVTAPSGRWFAYPATRGRRLIFRHADGSQLTRVPLPFRPLVIGAIAVGDRVVSAPWP